MTGKSKKYLLLGLAAAAGYKFYKGEGIFNKPRFYKEHKALNKYLEANYPNAYVGEITKTQFGWACIIDSDGRKIFINMEKSADGMYVFSASEMNTNQ